MLYDIIYSLNIETQEKKIFKKIDILSEPMIDSGDFSPACDYYVYMDEESKFHYNTVKV